MDTFSWSDSLRALAAPCISCLRSSKTERNDLEDLLVESGSATTADAETLSLHSNPGAARRKRSHFSRSIRLFGWDLFGRRPPIRLPDDDDDEDEEEVQREQAGKRKSRRAPPPTISSSTLDSDAAPLDSAAIVSHATKRAEEEAARAARRARRRERKEAKRAALALALEHAAILNGDAEFEGFPGSGSRRPAVPPSSSSVHDGATARQQELRNRPDDGGDYDDDDDDEGDFGAGAYTRSTSASSESGRGSDSRSRTSTSFSGHQAAHPAQSYNHHFISQQPSTHPAASAQAPPPPVRHTKKMKLSRSSASKASSSSNRSRSPPSAAQSPSLGSPVAPQFSGAFTVPTPPPASRTAQEFENLPNVPSLHTAGIERLSSGFPSPGIGGPRNGRRDLGAFLANRGGA
ncbi:hypothetical protein BC826DRAFT_165458 [Russula brevipes]|nr:hypothetical protein BC826DRAFT_165458 [Russula brevipes]